MFLLIDFDRIRWVTCNGGITILVCVSMLLS